MKLFHQSNLSKFTLYSIIGIFVLAACNTIPTATENKNTLARQIEFLDRGLIAVPAAQGVLVSWRLFNADKNGLKFDLYRDGKKITSLAHKSNYWDQQGTSGSIYELRSEKNVLAKTTTWVQPYLSIPITPPEDGVTPDGQTYSYTANDASVGDLDGDGQYEIILKWDPTNSKDNSQGGYTGKVFIDAYTLAGKKLWRIDLGKNIRAGAHYTQFMVYDFDGDGRAEIAMKTADGTIDGAGKVIGDAKANWVSGDGEFETRDRTGSLVKADGKLVGQLKGRIIAGPEYFTVFEGLTGRALDTVPYIPQRVPGNDNPTPAELKTVWNDGYANRSERYLAGVAYLDGKHPSVLMARGYYGRTVVAAYDFSGGKISSRWTFDSAAPGMPEHFGGQGNHQLSVADIDGDGKDEIIYGAMTIDDNGAPLWTTNLKHGDAMHVSDLDPTHPGLEKFGVHEDIPDNGGIGSALISLSDGKILWTKPAEKDTGRGVAFDIDPRFPGNENWASNSSDLYNIKGEKISSVHPKQTNFAVWWDGDLLRELLDGNTISKWDWNENKTNPLLIAEGCVSNNGTKSTPALSADIFGDWREEVIWRTADNKFLRIYSTAIPTDYGMPTLMEDTQYRVAIAWQNTAYNQPPHPSFYIGPDMKTPKKPSLNVVKAK